MNKYIIYELEQLEKITGYSLQHIKNDINDVYNKLEEKSKEIERLKEENKKIKNLEYKFFDNSGDEESFTLEDYLELGNKLYDYQEENERLNNIINELEKYCNICIGMNFNMNNSKLQEQIVEDYSNILDKLKELRNENAK